MKKVFLLSVLFFVAACSKVPAGNVGVKVNLLGSSKGVDVEELGVGRYWIGFNEELYLFPTFTQNYVWTKDVTEGSPNDESISFQTIEGMKVNSDIGISYSIDPRKATLVFQKYRRGVNEITDVFIRNMVRDALVTVASELPIESVYGRGKSELMEKVQAMVIEQVAPIGINVEKVYWIGEARLPASVVTALNAKIEATQKAAQRQNEVAQAKAEADKAIESARGESESRLLLAKAEAEAIRIKGDALKSNPELVRLNAIEKWDGVLPRINGGGVVPFLNVDGISAK